MPTSIKHTQQPAVRAALWLKPPPSQAQRGMLLMFRDLELMQPVSRGACMAGVLHGSPSPCWGRGRAGLCAGGRSGPARAATWFLAARLDGPQVSMGPLWPGVAATIPPSAGGWDRRI